MRDNRKEQVHILPVPDPNSNAICSDPEFITPLLLFPLRSAWLWRAISDRRSIFNTDEGTTEQIIPGGSGGRICQMLRRGDQGLQADSPALGRHGVGLSRRFPLNNNWDISFAGSGGEK